MKETMPIFRKLRSTIPKITNLLFFNVCRSRDGRYVTTIPDIMNEPRCSYQRTSKPVICYPTRLFECNLTRWITNVLIVNTQP